MTDGVKFIFKTLLKVPVFIFISYFIFNILAFCFVYFKMLGVSYVIMQTAVESNYIPTFEKTSLTKYMCNMENEMPMMSDAKIIVNNAGAKVWAEKNGASDYIIRTSGSTTSTDSALVKRQYGKTTYVGCECNYTVIWPLMPHEQVNNTRAVAGMDDTFVADEKSDADLEIARNNKRVTLPIRIAYEVPGLKYYPDLSTY